jgi:hypothetical protein
MIMERARFKFNLSYPLTLLGAIFFLILGSLAAVALYSYLRLEVSVFAVVDDWKVVKKSSSTYSIQGSYHFDFRGKTCQGSSVLPPPYHLNRPSAERARLKLEKEAYLVWIDPRHPEISSLERLFPVKKTIYALVALGVALYFWFVETSSRIRSPAN